MRIGAYAIEKDFSHYVAQAAKTVFAVVGTASKGPIGEAIVCTSPAELINKFGSLKTNCYGLYAGQYFLSQASKLYFVRAASSSATESTAAIAGTNESGASVEDILTIKAIEEGTYADGYTLTVSAGEVGADNIETYTLTLKNAAGTTLEITKNIKLEDMKVGFKTASFEITATQNPVSLTTGEAYTFAGGNDGIDDIADNDYITAANALAADTLDMNLFAIPGVTEASVITAMLSLAETRGDCLFLVDPPKGLTREGVMQWHNGTGSYEGGTKFDSSYGALYYDWVVIYDSVNKTNVEVPPSVVVPATYAYSDRTTDVWFAPAGLTRGIVRGVLETSTKLNKTEIESLYSEGNNVNCLYEDPQVGLVLWGQKTLQRTNTALDRVNVRRLMNYLKRVVVATCNYMTFDPNDRVTWNNFAMKIEPILENVQKRRGIYEYRLVYGKSIVTDSDIDNNRMPCAIIIRPTKSAEEIPITFAITSTGADFSEVLSNI